MLKILTAYQLVRSKDHIWVQVGLTSRKNHQRKQKEKNKTGRPKKEKTDQRKRTNQKRTTKKDDDKQKEDNEAINVGKRTLRTRISQKPILNLIRT